MRYDGLCENDGVWNVYDYVEDTPMGTEMDCLSWCEAKRRQSPCGYGPCGWNEDWSGCMAYPLTLEKDISAVEAGYSSSSCWVWPGKLVSNAHRL